MTAVDRLKRDHKILRSKLAVLESALTMGGEAWYVLREVCFTLAKQLRDHVRREEELIALCRARMSPTVLAEVSVAHRDEPQHLQTINRLFTTERTPVLHRIRPALEQVIHGLRHHMDEEERELFPILERTLTEVVPSVPQFAPTARHLDELMTVNRVVHDFPATQRAFERLFISVPLEGCTCLDEVAWRHGMETRELIGQLEDVIEACTCAERRSSAAAASAAAQADSPTSRPS